MNYISHLSAFYTKVYADDRFTPHHISLYSGIFQLWNTTRFEKEIFVNRQELMMLSKIGSVNTYVRCLRQLHDWQYIQYFPSKSMSIGSRISVIIFDKTTDNRSDTALRHSYKQNKTVENLPSKKEVSDYFKTEGFEAAQAGLFFNHYEAKGWLMGNAQIRNWQAAAVNWMARQPGFSRKPLSSSAYRAAKTNKLSVASLKNYHEAL